MGLDAVLVLMDHTPFCHSWQSVSTLLKDTPATAADAHGKVSIIGDRALFGDAAMTIVELTTVGAVKASVPVHHFVGSIRLVHH